MTAILNGHKVCPDQASLQFAISKGIDAIIGQRLDAERRNQRRSTSLRHDQRVRNKTNVCTRFAFSIALLIQAGRTADPSRIVCSRLHAQGHVVAAR